MVARLIHTIEVQRHDENFFLNGVRFSQDLARGISDETLAPEFYAVAGNYLVPHTVGHGDVTAVSDGVASLNRFPGIVLRLAVLRFFSRMPADRRGEKEDLRSAQ